MKIHRCTQGSAEWYAVRLGKPTASNFDKIITPMKMQLSKAYKDYMYKLCYESLFRQPVDDELGDVEWVQHGMLTEPHAAQQFKLSTEWELADGGFVTTDDERIGCSPDRLIVGRNEALEIKCPAPWTQLKYLDDGPGEKYRPQVQGQLMIGEWDIVHFYSYHPQCPAKHIETGRDEAFIRQLRQALRDFLEQMDQALYRLRKYQFVITPMVTPLERAYPDAPSGAIENIIDEAMR